MTRRFAKEWLWFVACAAVAFFAVVANERGDARKNPLGQLVRLREPDKFFGDFDAQIARRLHDDLQTYVKARVVRPDGVCEVRVPGLGVVEFPASTSEAEIAGIIRDRFERVEKWERVEGVPLEAYERAKFDLVRGFGLAALGGAVLYAVVGFVRLTVAAVAAMKRTT